MTKKGERPVSTHVPHTPAQRKLAVEGHAHEDLKSVSSYSAMLHPNEDPSEISQLGGRKQSMPKKKLGWFKRMVAWVDENWLKCLLVNKSSDQIQAADEIEDMLQ